MFPHVICTDGDLDTLSLCLLQYVFTTGEHEVKPAPHLNAKHSESYVRTMPSTLSKLKATASGSTAKKALAFVSETEGGIEHAKSAGSLPRSHQQVHDIRRKLAGPSDPDPIFSLMLMCKESQSQKDGNVFVQLVNGAPFPMMVLAYEWTLDDLVRFCTEPREYAILGVDPTFSLGDFDVTVTTYRHLLLHHRGDPHGNSPCLIGPLFVHLKKDFAAYHFFASSLISLRSFLSKLKCFGSDREDALVKAFSTAFPNAIHLRCFLHFRGNIEEKLRQLKLPSVVVKAFVHDVLGNPAQLEFGLVDAEDEAEFDSTLASLKVVWNEREKPYNSPPQFHSWFQVNCRGTVVENMLRPVRERALLGSPPQPYYTNEVESKNNVLKQQLKYKAAQLPQFVDHMKKLLTEQKREVERAVATMGEYRLSQEYSHLAVSAQKWFILNEQQRQRCINRFSKAKICRELPIQDGQDDRLIPEGNQSVDPEGCMYDEQSTSTTNPLRSLCIPNDIKSTLWSRGQLLAKDDVAMVRSPGSTTDWIVQSSTGKQPHFVKETNKGGYACDSNCLAYKSMRICSHTLAASLKEDCVQQLVEWHKKLKFTPNLTCIAEEGKPSGVGKKGHRKASSKAATKRIRKIVAQAEEKDFSKRVTATRSSSKFSGVARKRGKIATRKAATKHIGRTVDQADEENASKRVTDPQSSIEYSGVGRRGRRKILSKTATSCVGETVVQKDVSKGVIDQPSSTKLSGVAIGRQSQVHIEHVKVVTTSPRLVPTQLAPASSQAIGISPHLYASSAATGIAVPKVQLTAPSSLSPTGETGSTPTGIAPNLTTMPQQFIISSSPPLPTNYQIPTGYQLPPQLSPPPLVPISASTRPAVGDPFVLCFVQGNISRCNGCKGRIRRGDDRKPLPPPDDLVLRHVEFVVFQNPNTGIFQLTRTPRNVYYHPQKTCIAPHFLNFNPLQDIVIDSVVSCRLTPEHRLHLRAEFGLKFP